MDHGGGARVDEGAHEAARAGLLDQVARAGDVDVLEDGFGAVVVGRRGVDYDGRFDGGEDGGDEGGRGDVAAVVGDVGEPVAVRV